MLIERDRYILRPWQLADAPSLTKHMDNINIWNNLRDLVPYPYTLADAYSFINMVNQKDNLQDVAIVIDGSAVGGISIVRGKDVERISAELGYWLSESYWGKGIMTSVVVDFTEYVFTNTPISRLFATVFDFNRNSQYVLEKVGFRKIGILQDCAVKNNRVTSMVYYELVKAHMRRTD